MKKKPPKYYSNNIIVTADRCDPLINASQRKEVTLHTLARAGYPGTALSPDELPGLLSVGYWNAAHQQNWGLDTHCNEGIELAFLESGKLAFQADKKYTLKPGTMTITRPWQPHSLGSPTITPSRLHWIILDVSVRKPHQKWKWPKWLILDPADLNRLTALLSQNETLVWSVGAEILTCFGRIADVLKSPKSSVNISRMTILINELFLSLYETLSKRRLKLEPELITSHRTVELFLNDLNQNSKLLFQEWTIDHMADYCHLGVTHFTRLCRTLSNMTPMQYLNSQRIQASIHMMQTDPELSITDIAFRCGFNSSQYFATVFKQFKGCQPRHYKEKM